ncbi:MAG: nucleotide pyrophosphohydrolase [Methanotrichaceae archaeon]|nr:nucleotide pyrophosphohydrolase [Methanotrichaceae archaeon]
MSDSIIKLLNKILKFRRDRDWEKFHTPRNLAISISLEAAELLENFQWQVGEEPITPEIRERATKEIADIFIYLLSMSHDLGFGLIEAATKKLEESHARYPVKKSRGSSKKYTELT